MMMLTIRNVGVGYFLAISRTIEVTIHKHRSCGGGHGYVVPAQNVSTLGRQAICHFLSDETEISVIRLRR